MEREEGGSKGPIVLFITISIFSLKLCPMEKPTQSIYKNHNGKNFALDACDKVLVLQRL